MMLSTTKPHILATPVFLWGFRLTQLVIALVVLGLSAYGLTFISFDGDSLMLFSAIASIIIVIYVGISSLFVPAMYNYWAILGLDIFAIVFWVISFPLLASEIADYSGISTYDYCYYYCYHKSKRALVDKRATTTVETYRNAMIAASALGGVEFLLFIVTLVVTSIYLHRHRKAGGHCVSGSGGPTIFHESKIDEQPHVMHQAPATQHPPTMHQDPGMQYSPAGQQPVVMQQPYGA